MNTVEKVARAIWKRERDSKVHAEPFRLSQYEADARAALTALREPSEGMVEAGDEAMRKDGLDWSMEPGEGLDGVDSRPSWRAMINHALSEGEG
jgi:hypothetical protein